MPRMNKTALAAVIAMLALGSALAPAEARDGRRHDRAPAWHGGGRHWAPPRAPRHFRTYGHVRRYYAPRHRYWRRDRGNDVLFGALLGFAVGAVVVDSLSHHDHVYHSSTVVVGPPRRRVLIGYGIGGTMYPADHSHAALVLERTRTGEAAEWTNPDTGNRYSLTPTRTFRNATGEDCREYTVWGWIGGYEERLRGTACRTPDGAWRNVS